MALGSFSKDKLVFDPAFPNEGDNVGSTLRDPSGSLITSNPTSLQAEFQGTPPGGATDIAITANNSGPAGNITLTGDGVSTVSQLITAWNIANPGNQITLTAGNGSQIPTNLSTINLTGGADKVPLDVNIVGGIKVNVDLDGIYDAVFNPKPDNVGIVLFNRGAAPSITDEKFLPTGAQPNADAVDPANVFAQDVNSFGMGWNGTGWDRLTSTSGALDVHISNSSSLSVTGDILDDDPDANSKSLKVGSRSEWGALNALSANGDRGDLISDKYRRVYVNNGANIGLAHNNIVASSGGEVALKAGGSALEGRRLLMVQNLSNKEIYIGKTGLTAGNSLVLAARATIELDAGQDVGVFVLGSAATQDVRVFEMA